MTEDKFWQIIEQSRTGHGGSQDAQEIMLRKILMDLDVDEIVEFDRIFTLVLARSYNWDLWGAAYIINGGCSDDGFEYFRRGLIAAGRDKFEQALENAESLTDWAEPDEIDFEGIKYVAYDVYQEKTGTDEFPAHDIEHEEVAGEPWEEGGDDLSTRFPRLWAKFGA